MPKVCILLSTYNGEKHIAEQLESIINQKGVDVHIVIRDDGSVDHSIDIIEKFAKLYPSLIEFRKGNNLGFANSFYELLKGVNGYDYYAFADQDDVWEENKIETAIYAVDCEKPRLYASNLNVFDGNKKKKYLLFSEEKKDEIYFKLENYFYMYNPYGCTMVWNSYLQDELCKYEKPEKQTHDVWVNLIAHCVGKVIYDYNSYINYRLHEGNTCGITPSSFGDRIKKYYKFYFKNNQSLNIALSCSVIKELFPQSANTTISNFSNYNQNLFAKIRALFGVFCLKVNTYEKFKFIMLIIFNRF